MKSGAAFRGDSVQMSMGIQSKTLLQWSVFLPVQLIPKPKPDYPPNIQGRRRLQLAVLTAALQDYFRYISKKVNTKPRNKLEAWIHNPSTHYVFGFATICEEFDISPDAVRAVLKKIKEGILDGTLDSPELPSHTRVRKNKPQHFS